MRKLRSIRLLLGAVLLAAVAVSAVAERGDDAQRKSKNGKTAGTIDGVEVWRTGADEATTISFSADVAIGGETLAAGTYALFTIPGEGEWTFIFNKVAQQWGAFSYDQGQDALRVTAKPGSAEHVESMDFVIEGSSVVLRWAELKVGFEVDAAS